MKTLEKDLFPKFISWANMLCCRMTKLNREMNKEILPPTFQRSKIQGKKILKKTFKKTIQVCTTQTRETGKAILDPKNMCEESHNFRLGYKILDKV